MSSFIRRCVRVLDEDGGSYLPGTSCIVRINAHDTFFDVLDRLVQPGCVVLQRIQLKAFEETPDAAAIEIREANDAVIDVIGFVQHIQKFDPCIMTFLVKKPLLPHSTILHHEAMHAPPPPSAEAEQAADLADAAMAYSLQASVAALSEAAAAAAAVALSPETVQASHLTAAGSLAQEATAAEAFPALFASTPESIAAATSSSQAGPARWPDTHAFATGANAACPSDACLITREQVISLYDDSLRAAVAGDLAEMLATSGCAFVESDPIVHRLLVFGAVERVLHNITPELKQLLFATCAQCHVAPEISQVLHDFADALGTTSMPQGMSSSIGSAMKAVKKYIFSISRNPGVLRSVPATVNNFASPCAHVKRFMSALYAGHSPASTYPCHSSFNSLTLVSHSSAAFPETCPFVIVLQDQYLPHHSIPTCIRSVAHRLPPDALLSITTSKRRVYTHVPVHPEVSCPVCLKAHKGGRLSTDHDQ